MSTVKKPKDCYLQWWIKFLRFFSVGFFDPNLEEPIQNRYQVAAHLITWIFLMATIIGGIIDAQTLNERFLDLTGTGSMTLSITKFIIYCRFRHTIHNIIRIIEFETIFRTRTDKFILKAVSGTREIVFYYILMGTISFGSYMIIGIVSKPPEHLEGQVKLWEIIHLYIPFDYVVFERFGLLRVGITIILLYHGYCLMFLDLLTSALLIHVGMQFEAAAFLFSSINFSIEKNRSVDNDSVEVLDETDAPSLATPAMEVQKAVEYHRLILKCSNDLQRVFSGIFMLQIIGSCTPLCFCMFLVLQAIKSHEEYMNAMGHTAYLTFLMYQLYMMVRCAEITTERASSVADGIYMSNWNLSTPSMKRQLAYIIQKAQQPVEYSALGVFPVTVKTFISIVKGAYTALTLMSNMD